MNTSTCPTLQAPRSETPAREVSEPELVRLRDGSIVTVREVTEHDEPSLRAFLDGLCLETRRLRFFGPAVDLERIARWAAEPTIGGFGLVAYSEAGAVVAHATYAKVEPTRAEVAVEVADHLHGHGLGTLLVARLAAIAERDGITHFVAVVLSDNHAMLDVFREGFDGRVIRRDGPELTVEFLTSGWRLANERFHLSTTSEA
jgi:L-amino acid N-acyltransferase YncA